MQSHDFASTYVGTPFYMSPEICAAERYTMHSDIWSLGCIVYELCTKTPPFNAKTHFHLVQKIKEGRFDPLPACYSPELSTLVRNCLIVNPQKRPDTWELLQLPVVRLMRKEREVVELGATLKLREERALAKAKEAEALLASLDQDRQVARVEIDDVVRREWEVKARLEIDRQVTHEKERLEKIFETELASRVEQEVDRRLHSSDAARTTTISSEAVPSLSSVSTAPSTEGPSTDESSLFTNGSDLMESPVCAGGVPAPAFQQPAKRAHRTPFSRARTQIDSPMDVTMASPSPMSIASLSLSPRRAAAMAQGVATTGANLFVAAADARARWEPQTLSTLDSDSESDSPSREGAHSAPPIEEDNDSDVDGHASPTRRRARRAVAPSAIPDPFKVPNGSRPGLARQRTVPSRRPGASGPQAPLFAGKPVAGTQAPQRRDRSPTSPQRRAIPRPLSKAATAVAAAAAAGSNENAAEDMLRAVTNKNMAYAHAHGNAAGVGGRTLVELQQARAGMDAPAMMSAMNGNAMGMGAGVRKAAGYEEVARWDPEQEEEMPSPFLCRVKRDFMAR
jgi:NIMA (never in mitosis gene a)-related kinase 2